MFGEYIHRMQIDLVYLSCVALNAAYNHVDRMCELFINRIKLILIHRIVKQNNALIFLHTMIFCSLATFIRMEDAAKCQKDNRGNSVKKLKPYIM